MIPKTRDIVTRLSADNVSRVLSPTIAAALLVFTPPGVHAQQQGGSAGGIRVDTVSLYQTYYSPVDLYRRLSTQSGPNYAITAGGSVSTRWTRIRPRSRWFGSYAGSYSRDMTYARGSGMVHAFSMAFIYDLTRHWSATVSVNTQLMDTSDFLFWPTTFSRITDVAGTPDDLAAAILSGVQHDNQQLAALLLTTPIAESPARRLFFGDRVLNGVASTTVSYTKGRLGATLTAGASRSQTFSRNSSEPTPLVPRIIGGSANVSLAYSLSPRTQVGASLSSQRQFWAAWRASASSGSLFVQRRFSRRWFLEAHGGAGIVMGRRYGNPSSASPQYIGGVGLGYGGQQHSFLVSFERSVTDNFGLFSTSNITGNATWNWRPRRSGWRLLAGTSAQHMRIPGFPNINALQGNAGCERRLLGNTSMVVTYAYSRMLNHGQFQPDWSGHAVRVAFVWMPGALRH